jgi:hypothetical protein
MCHRPDIQSLQPEHNDTCIGVLQADGGANIARNHFNSMNANTNVGSGQLCGMNIYFGFISFCIFIFLYRFI